MGFDETLFSYFNEFCVNKFGSDIGKAVNIEAENRLSHMIKEADYRNNKYIRWHMDANMLPSIAIYLAFKKFPGTADKAYEYTDEVLQVARLKIQKKNQLIGRLPFGYFGFKMLCKSIVTKQYPEQGWDMQWIRYDKKEIHFNMKSCIYFDTTKKYNCIEMCPLFCANDDVILSGYKPQIIFERSGTIARGQDLCDFHFKNCKYIK
jgi:hypothetical protein